MAFNSPAVFSGSGLGSWFANAPGGWVDNSDSGRFASGGSSYGVPAVSFYNSSTLGQWFNVTAPNGVTQTLQQLDLGPSLWTGKSIDITGAAGANFGYTPNNFPTGSTFTWTGPFGSQSEALGALNGNVFTNGADAIPYAGATPIDSNYPGLAGTNDSGIGGFNQPNVTGFGADSGFVQGGPTGLESFPSDAQGPSVAGSIGYGGFGAGTGSFTSGSFGSPDNFNGSGTGTSVDTSSPAAAASSGDEIGQGLGNLGDVGSGSGGGGLGGLFSGLGGLGSLFGGGDSSNSSGSGDPTFFAWLGDWALRGAVIILGFVFVVAGLYMLKGNLVLQGPGLANVAKAASKVA